MLAANPNEAHHICAEMEKEHSVTVVTQNVDDLHERGGSTNVVHLHGEVVKAQSSHNPNLVYPGEGPTLKIGDKCARGSQLRPHVVFFGEPILRWKGAVRAAGDCDAFIVVGTSLEVLPASSLVEVVPHHARIYVVDPDADLNVPRDAKFYCNDAISGMQSVYRDLKENPISSPMRGRSGFPASRNVTRRGMLQ